MSYVLQIFTFLLFFPYLTLSAEVSASSVSSTANQTKQCNPMPKIESAMVYQSVKSPQIEPLDKQKTEIDPQNPNDLVVGKPAAVLLHLTEIEKINDKYSIVLKVDDKLVKTNCTRDLEKKNLKNLKKSYLLRKITVN